MNERLAVPGDLGRIMEIIAEARRSLAALGIDQWQDGYPGADDIAADIAAGRRWVLTEGGEILASAAVYVGHEETYDELRGGAWGADAREYGIIHRIAVAKAARGRGAASRLVALCREMAVSAGVPCLRCDTHQGNLPMRRMLERNGYVLRGKITLKTGEERVAYEKMLP